MAFKFRQKNFCRKMKKRKGKNILEPIIIGNCRKTRFYVDLKFLRTVSKENQLQIEERKKIIMNCPQKNDEKKIFKILYQGNEFIFVFFFFFIFFFNFIFFFILVFIFFFIFMKIVQKFEQKSIKSWTLKNRINLTGLEKKRKRQRNLI